MNETTVKAKWIGPDLEYEGTDTKGNVIKMGGNSISPAQMLLLGAAGCMGMDVVVVLNKKRIAVDSIEVTVTGHQPDDYPKPFEIVGVHFSITGQNVSEKAVQKAIDLSRDKYCIVGQTLQHVVDLKTSYQINNKKRRV